MDSRWALCLATGPGPGTVPTLAGGATLRGTPRPRVLDSGRPSRHPKRVPCAVGGTVLPAPMDGARCPTSGQPHGAHHARRAGRTRSTGARPSAGFRRAGRRRTARPDRVPPAPARAPPGGPPTFGQLPPPPCRTNRNFGRLFCVRTTPKSATATVSARCPAVRPANAWMARRAASASVKKGGWSSAARWRSATATASAPKRVTGAMPHAMDPPSAPLPLVPAGTGPGPRPCTSCRGRGDLLARR